MLFVFIQRFALAEITSRCQSVMFLIMRPFHASLVCVIVMMYGLLYVSEILPFLSSVFVIIASERRAVPPMLMLTMAGLRHSDVRTGTDPLSM